MGTLEQVYGVDEPVFRTSLHAGPNPMKLADRADDSAESDRRRYTKAPLTANEKAPPKRGFFTATGNA